MAAMIKITLRLISLVAFAGAICLFLAGCGGKTTNQPVGGTSTASILTNPNSSPDVKAQAVAQQQIASRMQRVMSQLSQQQMAAMRKK